MTSPTKEVHQFYDFYRPTDASSYRFGKRLGDSSHRADRDDSKMLADSPAGLSRLRPDVDTRKDKKDMYTNPKRLSFADTLSSKRLDRMTLERELDEASAQMDELRQKNRSLRHQLNLANQEREKQSMDREKALTKLERSRTDQMRMVNEMEIIRKENNILQKKLDQNDHQVDGDLANHLSDTVKQVQQLTKEKDDIQRRLLEEMENIKDSLDEAINDRDELKYRISELQQEKEKLLDRIASMAPGFETTGSELDKMTDQRDSVQSRRGNQNFHSRSSNRSSPDRDDLVELESLREKCAVLEQERDELLIKIETMRSERQCSVTSTDDEGVGSMTECRHDEDLRSKISALEEENCNLKETLEATTKQLNSLQSNLGSAKEQIKHVMREKGVALRESTATFEESVQLQSRIVELSAEKDCAVEQRKIATKEKERVITESVSLKNKLEAIMLQRQKDAKELGNMRRSKEQAYQELTEIKKYYRELKEKTKQSEYELTLVAETICSQLNIEKKGNVSSLLHRYIEQVQLEKESFLSRLFNGQKHSNITLGDACARLDVVMHERNCLATELERTQRNEKDKDKIAKLNDQVNGLTFERDNLQEQLDKMNSKIARHNAELKRCGTQIQQLQKEKNELQMSHAEVVEQHAKTLERVDEMWKHRSRPQIRWDELWEERHLSLDMETAGSAGFAIMGGRDQQQLPNPNAVIVTHINADSPACNHLMPGDVLESVNGVNLSNVDHCDAVCAISDNKGILNLVIRRCKNPIAFKQIQNGAAAMPIETNTEEHDYSLLFPKEGIGFKYHWTVDYQVTEVIHNGPAHQILQVGDKITKVNEVEVSHVKNSAFKKLLKPQKGVLRLKIVRSVKDGKQDGLKSNSARRRHSTSATKSYSRSSSEISNDIGPEAVVVGRENGYRPASSGSFSSRNSSNYSFTKSHDTRGATRESSATADHDSPTRLKSSFYSPTNIRAERPSRDDHCSMKGYDRPMSQDSTETGYSARPTKLLSSQDSLCTGSSCSSHSSGSRVHFADIPETRPLKRGMGEYGSIDYDTNNNSNKMFAGFSNSQTESVNLSFHSQSYISHNHLTVETTQQTLTGSDDDEPYGNLAPFARDDVHRTTVRTRSMTSLTDNRNSFLLSNGYQAESEHSSQASQPSYIGLTKLRSLGNSRSATMGKREHSASTSRIGGVRRNSHTGSTISTSTITSARSLSNLDDRYYNEHDPLCNATYLRANFAYIPRYRKELHVSIGDVFHIHDESPEHHKASFWVSRLNENGTDADIGVIPNSPRAKYYIAEQGEDLEDFSPVYTEVEPYQDKTPRPVLIFGVAAEALIEQLLEEHPETFVSPKPDIVEASSKINTRTLDDDIASGYIISYTQRSSGIFEVLKLDSIKFASKKSKHCLLVGTIPLYQALAEELPPISIFIKAQAPESISLYDPNLEDLQKAVEKYRDLKQLEHEHGNKFSVTLCLVMLELLVGQIQKEVIAEQKKMSWVPIKRDY